ncbi:hypothetical protein BGZ63DRAFT_429209 [Mariannaea sp. PMI_226]|nr:hypothetical protein BGZ63DRAFT_429209 [Mariannaea sp. PMI_226]
MSDLEIFPSLILKATKYLDTKHISKATEIHQLMWKVLLQQSQTDTITYINYFIRTVDLGRVLGMNDGDEERTLSLLETLRNSPGRENDEAKISSLLARLHYTKNQFDKSEVWCRTALKLYKRTNSKPNDILVTESLLAKSLHLNGKFREALKVAKAELAARIKLKPKAKETIESMNECAYICQLVNLEEAAKLQVKARGLAEKKGYKSLELDITLQYYHTLAFQGKVLNLDGLVEKLIKEMEEQDDVIQDKITTSRYLLSRVYFAQGHYTKSIELCRELMNLYQKEGQDAEYFETMSRLGVAMIQSGDLKQGGEQVETALEWMRKNLGDAHRDTLRATFYLVGLLCKHGNYDRALAECYDVLESHRKSLGLDHPDTLEVKDYVDYIRDLQAQSEKKCLNC